MPCRGLTGTVNDAPLIRFPPATLGSAIQRGTPETRSGLPAHHVYRRRSSHVNDRIRRPASEDRPPHPAAWRGNVKGNRAGERLPDVVIGRAALRRRSRIARGAHADKWPRRKTTRSCRTKCTGSPARRCEMLSATHAHVRSKLRFGTMIVRLRVRDDGIGIDPKIVGEGGRPGHWGLRGVHERAKRIGAQLKLWSEAGAGTELELTVPASVAYGTSRNGPGFRLFREKPVTDEHRS